MKGKITMDVFVPYESDTQKALFEWVSWNLKRYPELKYLHHIPNGGKRDKATALNMKKEGVKAGVSDLFLPVPKGGKHGLYIELKRKGNVPTKAQNKWLEDMAAMGYGTAVCYSTEEAIKTLTGYLS